MITYLFKSGRVENLNDDICVLWIPIVPKGPDVKHDTLGLQVCTYLSASDS